MNTYDISPAEVDAAFHAPASAVDAPVKRSKADVAKTLFTYLGAIFILSGIGTYIGTFWDTMGSVMRVFVTLGAGYLLLIVQVAALHESRYPRLILPLTLASVFMMTGGWYVLLEEMYPDSSNWRAATLFVFGVMAVHQGALYAKYRRTVMAFTALFFIYGFMHVGFDMLDLELAYIAIILGASLLLVGTALEKSPHRALAEFALLIGVCWLNSGLYERVELYTSGNWASLLIGVSLMLTAYGMHKSERYPRLIALGYFVGSIMAYAGLFDLVQNSPLELVYLAVTAAMLYVCVVLESKALLLNTVLAMLGFIATLDHPEMVGVNPEFAHETMAGLNFLHAVAQAWEAGKLFHIDLNDQRIGRYDQDFRFGAENIKMAFYLVKFLEDVGYDGSRHFDAHAYRSADYEDVKAFARGCMRTYLILKEKAGQFNADPEIQELLAQIHRDDGSMDAFKGTYSTEKAKALKAHAFDRSAMAERGQPYEKLDQLLIELLLGVR